MQHFSTKCKADKSNSKASVATPYMLLNIDRVQTTGYTNKKLNIPNQSPIPKFQNHFPTPPPKHCHYWVLNHQQPMHTKLKNPPQESCSE